MNMPLLIDRLPHQPPMRWIRSATGTAEDQVVAEAVLPAQSGEDGRAPVLLGLEILAQAAGVLLSASAEPSEESAAGRLLQVKAAKWTSDSLPIETVIEAKVTRAESSAIGLHQFTGTLSLDSGKVVLEAEFSLLQTTV